MGLGGASGRQVRSLALNGVFAAGAAVWAVRVVGPARPGALTAQSVGLAVALLVAALAMDATRVVWGSDRAGRAQAATAANAVLLPAAVLLPPGLFLTVAAGTAVGFVNNRRGLIGMVGNATIRVGDVSVAAVVFTMLAPGWSAQATSLGSVAALLGAGLAMVVTEALLVVNLARSWDGLDARELPLLDVRGLVAETPEVLLGAVFCVLYPTPATLLAVGLIGWVQLTVRQQAGLRLAARDPKTGLLSWPGFEQLAAAELQRASRSGGSVCLLLMDLDRLKQVNTGLGHLAGDRYIETAAATLAASARSYDLLARFGGDEFALLLPETTLDEATTAAERIRATIAATRLPGLDAPMGISIGVAAAEPDQGVRGLVATADTALRQAKANNRNQVVTVKGAER